MKYRKYILIALSLLLLLLFWALRSCSPIKRVTSNITSNVPDSTLLRSNQENASFVNTNFVNQIPKSQEELEKVEKVKRQNVIGNIVSVLNTSIHFYGQVVDQNGKPVPNAKVGYGLVDKFNESGTNGHTTADENGNFEINASGGAIGVTVSKEGYYYIKDSSYQKFAYGVGADAYHKPPPSKDRPAVFVLQKAGSSELLIKIEKYVKVPRDGTPVYFDLSRGEITVKPTETSLSIEAWTNDEGANGAYDWKWKISIPGGGLAERKGEFDFEAPLSAYHPSDEFVMSKSAERWQSQASKQYFIKFPKDQYGRMHFHIFAGGDHFFKIESYVNPILGSRNLEYDPKKSVNYEIIQEKGLERALSEARKSFH